MSKRYSVDHKKGIVTSFENELPIVDQVDVIVAGGGVAGLSAAVGSGRVGGNTLLIEGQGFLGGIATASMMNLWTIPYQYVNGIAKEIYSRLEQSKGAILDKSVPFHIENFKMLSLELLQEVSAKLLLYSWVVDVIKSENRAVGVIVENKSGRQAILSKCIVDTTGDADISARSDVPYIKGREKDSKMRPITLMFRMENVDIGKIAAYRDRYPDEFSPDRGHNIFDLEKGFVRLDGFFSLTEAARERGEVHDNCHYIRVHGIAPSGKGIMTINSTRIYNMDGTSAKDLTFSHLEGLKQIQQLVGFLRKHIPGFKESTLLDCAPAVGVRETRRIKGEHILTESEISKPVVFPDSIGRVYAHTPQGVEIHSPDAGEGSANDPYVRSLQLEMCEFYIPYRSLIPLHIDNLLVGGRCISSTHEADSSTRGQPVCMLTGQAAGIGAAISAFNNVAPRQLDPDLVRKELRRQGVEFGASEVNG